jgi:hypothetical protein
MAFPFRQPRLKQNARFYAADPTREAGVFDPDGVTNRINSVLRRRRADRVEAVLQATCAAGDLETAGDLLTVLSKMQERERREFGGERRVSDDPVDKARKKLATSKAAKTSFPA